MTLQTDPARASHAPGPSRTTPPAPIPLVVAAVAVAAAALIPAIYIAIRSTDRGWAYVLDTLLDRETAGLLVRTALLTVAVTASAVAIAVPLAWLTVRTDVPARRALTVLTAMPLVVPSYVGGFVFVAALSPRGIVQGWLEPFGVERLPSIYGAPGAWLVLTLFTYPYVLLTVRAALRNLDPSLEEAARSLGASPRETFRRVILPQLRPSIVAGALLVALYTLHDFGAVSLLRFDSFTRAIFVQYRGSFDRTGPAILSAVLVVLALVVVAGEARARSGSRYSAVHAGGARAPRISPLGRLRWPAFAACCLVATVALVLPAAVIVYWLVRAVSAGETFTPLFAAGWNSVRASALAALAGAVAAWPIAMLGARHPGRVARQVERASFVGFALPGIVVALSLVFIGARLVPGVYQTLGMLVFAYVVLFLPQAVGSLRANLLQLSPALEDAARSLGSTRLRTIARVVLPSIRPGVFAAFALVFLTAMKELPATLLLAPTGFDTLATEVWGATNAAAFGRAAIPALVLIVIAAVPLSVLAMREAPARDRSGP